VISNPGQEDQDVDDIGDQCDNCASTFNPFQEDQDTDQAGDACDNCMAVYNPTQSNFDADIEGDNCDLDDGLIYMAFSGPVLVEWQDESRFWKDSPWRCFSFRGAGHHVPPSPPKPSVETAGTRSVVTHAGQPPTFQ